MVQIEHQMAAQIHAEIERIYRCHLCCWWQRRCIRFSKPSYQFQICPDASVPDRSVRVARKMQQYVSPDHRKLLAFDAWMFESIASTAADFFAPSVVWLVRRQTNFARTRLNFSRCIRQISLYFMCFQLVSCNVQLANYASFKYTNDVRFLKFSSSGRLKCIQLTQLIVEALFHFIHFAEINGRIILRLMQLRFQYIRITERDFLCIISRLPIDILMASNIQICLDIQLFYSVPNRSWYLKHNSFVASEYFLVGLLDGIVSTDAWPKNCFETSWPAATLLTIAFTCTISVFWGW